MEPKLFVATKAFIEHDGKVLIVRESRKYADGSNHGSYDVVGGRLNPGEHFADALRREVKEETGLDIELGGPFFVNEWCPTVRGEQWQIVGIFFRCHARSTAVVLGRDHDDYKWIDPRRYKDERVIENLNKAFDAYTKVSSG